MAIEKKIENALRQAFKKTFFPIEKKDEACFFIRGDSLFGNLL